MRIGFGWTLRTRRALAAAAIAGVAGMTGLAMTAPSARAQPLREAGEPPFDNIVSINPVLLVFYGLVSADYERRLTPGTTLGASASRFALTDADYVTAEARARYYVTGRTFDGLSVGALIGGVRMRADSGGRTARGLTVGFTGEYQRLAGADGRLALTAGGGASRVFFADDRRPFRRVLPVVRLSAGWGF